MKITNAIVFRDDITIKIDEEEVAFTLGARDFKGVQAVAYTENTWMVTASETDNPNRRPEQRPAR